MKQQRLSEGEYALAVFKYNFREREKFVWGGIKFLYG